MNIEWHQETARIIANPAKFVSTLSKNSFGINSAEAVANVPFLDPIAKH
jgi:hypothetical protein